MIVVAFKKIFFEEIDDSIFEEEEKDLSTYSSNRINRYINKKDRILSLSSRLLFKKVLHHFFKIDENDGTYDYEVNQFGKEKLIPRFKGQKEIKFNISHSGEFCAVIVTDEENVEVGIDLQKSRKDFASNFDDRFLTDFEKEAFKLVEEDCKKTELLSSFWSMKESVLKCLGTGLSKFPTHVEIDWYSYDVRTNLNFLQTEDYEAYYSLKDEDVARDSCYEVYIDGACDPRLRLRGFFIQPDYWCHFCVKIDK